MDGAIHRAHVVDGQLGERKIAQGRSRTTDAVRWLLGVVQRTSVGLTARGPLLEIIAAVIWKASRPAAENAGPFLTLPGNCHADIRLVLTGPCCMAPPVPPRRSHERR